MNIESFLLPDPPSLTVSACPAPFCILSEFHFIQEECFMLRLCAVCEPHTLRTLPFFPRPALICPLRRFRFHLPEDTGTLFSEILDFSAQNRHKKREITKRESLRG